MVNDSSTCLTQSAVRAVAADKMHEFAPQIDGLLVVDLIDNVCWTILRNAYLTDEQAREVLALLWNPTP